MTCDHGFRSDSRRGGGVDLRYPKRPHSTSRHLPFPLPHFPTCFVRRMVERFVWHQYRYLLCRRVDASSKGIQAHKSRAKYLRLPLTRSTANTELDSPNTARLPVGMPMPPTAWSKLPRESAPTAPRSPPKRLHEPLTRGYPM